VADYAAMLRDGVRLIKETTDSLQAYVDLKQWSGQSVYGVPTYSATKRLKAIIVQAPNMHKTTGGQTVATQAYAAFLEPIPPNGVAGRLEPIDPRDVIIFPDGTTGPIVEVKGFIDAGTGRPMFSEVWFGMAGAGSLSS
jgi:hypothetical protein